MAAIDEFTDVRADPDLIRRARRATQLLAVYQQRSAELARLRREALEQAHRDLGLTYSEIAEQIGVTKGRVTQIRTSAPAPERALFGVGPVTIVTPYRLQATDRERPLLAAEDVTAADAAATLLGALGFTTHPAHMGPDESSLPKGDLFLICGPKSSPAVAHLLDTDPRLTITRDDRGWFLLDRATDSTHRSPLDEPEQRAADVAYVSRRTVGNRTITHVAGIHAIGSLGAVTHLAAHAHELYRDMGDRDFSLIVASTHEGLAITGTKVVGAPQPWTR